MRIGAALCAFLAGPAGAEELILHADPAPIIEVEINHQKIRLEIDTRLPDVLLLNPQTAHDLRIQTIPFVQAAIAVDDAVITAKIGRPDLRYPNHQQTRATTLLFDFAVSERAAGVIGPGALPYDRIAIVLADPKAGERRTHHFELKNLQDWRIASTIAPDLDADVQFDVSHAAAVLNRPATDRLAEGGLLHPAGDLARTSLLLSLSTLMQPATAEAAVNFDGLLPQTLFARTPSPIVASNDSLIVVTARSKKPQKPSLILGRASLADCQLLTFDRASRSLTLECAS